MKILHDADESAINFGARVWQLKQGVQIERKMEGS
jgi:hypothetical protein